MVDANTHSPPRMIFTPDERAAHEERLGVTPPTAAHIEIIEPTNPGADAWPADLPILPSRVLINGHDVGLVATNGVTINPGDAGNATTVTLTLIPGHVEIKRATMPTET